MAPNWDESSLRTDSITYLYRNEKQFCLIRINSPHSPIGIGLGRGIKQKQYQMCLLYRACEFERSWP